MIAQKQRLLTAEAQGFVVMVVFVPLWYVEDEVQVAGLEDAQDGLTLGPPEGRTLLRVTLYGVQIKSKSRNMLLKRRYPNS